MLGAVVILSDKGTHLIGAVGAAAAVDDRLNEPKLPTLVARYGLSDFTAASPALSRYDTR